MKKVVLLAGVVAAGMAVAPVAANAAAPEVNDIQEINAGVPKTDYASLHGVIDERSKALYDLEKAVANKTGQWSTLSDAAQTAILTDIHAMQAQLGTYFNDLDDYYADLTEAQQNGGGAQNAKLTDWKNKVDEVDNYLYNVVSPATFDALEATYSHFAQDLDKWNNYNKEILGVTSGGGYATWKLDDKYQGVNEMEDVIAATTNFETTTKNAATTALGPKPDLGAVDGVPTFDATASHPVDAPAPIEAAIQAYKDAKKDLQDLVDQYYADKTTLNNTYTEKTPAGYDEKKNQDNDFSAGWKASVDAAAEAAANFINTFDAADPATWNSAKTGEGATIDDEAAYKAGAEALLADLQTAIDNEAANVTAYNDLMTVLNQASADVAVLRTTYWNKRKEGHAGSLAFPENDRYVYRALILGLENVIANDKSDVAAAFQNGDVTTDCVGLLGGKTAEQYLESLLQDIDDAEADWAANEAANDAADVYFGRQDHHEASTADEAYYESFNLGSLRNDAKDAIAHIDDHAAGQPFEVVEIWDPTTETYVAKQINAADYNANFTCEHSEAVHGFTQLYTDLQAARQAQFDAYNAIGAAAWNLLNVKDAAGEETGFVAEYNDHLNLIKSQASTDQAQLYTERAQAELDKTKKEMEELDGVCEEVRTCDDADCGEAQANPCGWHHAATAAALEAIEGTDGSMNAANAAIDADHDAEKANDATIAAAKAAGTAIEAEVAAWKVLFEAADAKHKKNLDDTYAETTDAIHDAIHVVAAQAEFDLHNFEAGDIAAADLWAKALTGLDLDLDGTADTFNTFEEFVAALDAADDIYKAEAKDLYDNHFWTKLNALLEAVKALQGADTYKQAVETNRTARIVLETQLAEKQAELEAERNAVDAAKVYSSVTNPGGKDDYTALTDDVVVDDTYDTDLKKALKALADEAKAIETAYNNGKAGAYTEDGEAKEGYALNATAVDAAIAAYVAAVDAAEQLYRENKRCLDKYTEEFKTVLATKLGIDTVLENADVYTAFAANGDDDADVTKLTKTGIVAAALAAYNTAYAADYAHLAQFKTGELWANEVAHDGHIVALTALVKDYEDAVLKAVKLYADNVQARDAKTAEIGDLQNELDAILVDAHKLYGTGDTVNAADKANEYGPLTGTVNSIQEAINDAKGDLDKAFAAGTAPAYTVPATIATSIEALRQAVMDAEYFKAQNEKNYVTLREEVTNLVTAVESLKLDVDMYGQIENGTAEHPEYAAVNEYDRESIENVLFGYIDEDGNAVKGLKENLEDLLTALETACGNGTLYTDAQVNAQQAKINALVSEFEALKMQVDIAENIYAENAKALVRLQSQAQTIHALLDTAKANCVCSACNNEDNNELGGEFATLNEIKNNFQNSFEVAELVDLVTLNFVNDETHYRNQLESLEARVRETLDKIQEHKLRQLRDQDAYNMLQKALLDVDLWLANVQAEDGWENFAVRGAHAEATMCNGATSNPNVKYLNELTNDVNDLKLLIEAQHTHAGWDVDYDKGIVGLGHVCEENKIDDIKAMKALIEDAKTLIAAIQANEAAHELIIARFDELKDDALAAYKFWHQYYSEQTLTDPAYNWNIANQNWIKDVDGTLENGDYLITIQNYLHDSYVHGSAAYTWTVDAKGEELNGDANTFFGGYDQTLAHDRNYLAHEEAVNHYNQVALAITDYKALTEAEYSSEVDGVTSWDPFVRKWENGKFVGVYEDWSEEVEGENGLIAALNLYKEDIEAAYAEGVMEDAINIDEHNRAQGIHQQLNNLAGLLETIKAEYAALFEAAHHLTNGKTVYSDQEYFTLGFFQKANDGLGFQGQEMFNTVVVNDMDKINVLDLTAYESEDVYEDPTDFNSPYTTTYATDEDGNLIRWNDGYATDVQVLVNGNKQNELTFNIPQPMAPLAVTTLLAGPADIEFLPEAITVDEWLTRHNVYISFNVAEPVVEENQDVDAAASSSKLIVRVANPVDLTYTSKVLVATTNTGDQFSFADATFNTAKGQIEFELPEGTESVVLPEGFFTFRTGENTIARSAACTVVVAGATSIEGLIAMGEKAQIFDLQGRRVKAEALISGNTYVVNGEKVMVK